MTEDLRARLARVDPERATDLEASPRAQEIRERVMRTIDEETTTTPVRPAPGWRRPALVMGAAAGVAAVAVAAAVLAGGGERVTPAPRTPTTMALKANAAGGPVMGSCIQFSVDVLRDMPVAFGGTVVATTPAEVTLDVDRWYRGGDADRVTIATPDGTTSVALDGVEFTQGARYLVTATDGTVNTCGYSGPATAELEAAFGQAFPG